MLTQATAAVVVLGRLESHAWVEDASLAMLAMMLEARELGIGSCWVQVRHMVSEKIGSDGNPLTSNKDLQELLHFPDGLEVEAILSLGYPLHPIRPRKLADLRPFRVHCGKWE